MAASNVQCCRSIFRPRCVVICVPWWCNLFRKSYRVHLFGWPCIYIWTLRCYNWTNLLTPSLFYLQSVHSSIQPSPLYKCTSWRTCVCASGLHMIFRRLTEEGIRKSWERRGWLQMSFQSSTQPRYLFAWSPWVPSTSTAQRTINTTVYLHSVRVCQTVLGREWLRGGILALFPLSLPCPTVLAQSPSLFLSQLAHVFRLSLSHIFISTLCCTYVVDWRV